MSTTSNTQSAPNYKARIAWSIAVLIVLGLSLPVFQPVRVRSSVPVPITAQPQSYVWILAAAALILAVVPWIPRRFSVRALLILMTLVAVGLAVCVWMARNNSLAAH
jgi:hypothetical protein